MGINRNFEVKASSEVGAAGGSSITFVNRDHKGLVLTIDNTAESGTNPTVTVTISGVDDTGDTWTILASTALAAQAVTTLTVCPGSTPAANVVTDLPLPRRWKASWAIGGTDTPKVTFRIGGAYVG